MAEHLIRNEAVGGSTPPISSKNWSPKTETFFLEAVDFTGVDVLEDYTWSLISVSKFLDTLGYTLRLHVESDKCIQISGYTWIHFEYTGCFRGVNWSKRM